MQQLDSLFVRRVLDSAPEGVAICDARGADFPVLYVNAAFELLTGYAAAELIGSNLRILQGSDREQDRASSHSRSPGSWRGVPHAAA